MRRLWLIPALAASTAITACSKPDPAPSGPAVAAEAASSSQPATPTGPDSPKPTEAEKSAEKPAEPAKPAETAAAAATAADAPKSTGAKPAAPPGKPTPTATAATPASLKADSAAVRKLFDAYRKAIMEKKGGEAADLVSDKTLAYFEAMRVAALEKPAAEVRSAPLMDRTMILLLRASVGKEDLLRWSGRDLFIAAIDRGWVGDDVQAMEADEIVIHGDEALLGGGAGGKSLPPELGLRAYREGKTWKLDVMSIRNAAEPALLKELQKLHPDVDRALIAVIGALLQRKIEESIWEPLAAKP